jgi:hypothetical protein
LPGLAVRDHLLTMEASNAVSDALA